MGTDVSITVVKSASKFQTSHEYEKGSKHLGGSVKELGDNELSRCVAKRQSSKPRESSHMQRLDRVLRVQRKNYFKREIFHIFYQISFFKFFLRPRSPSLCLPTTPESFTHIGSALCEIIRVHRRKSALLGYQSLARYRSLGFDN